MRAWILLCAGGGRAVNNSLLGAEGSTTAVGGFDWGDVRVSQSCSPPGHNPSKDCELNKCQGDVAGFYVHSSVGRGCGANFNAVSDEISLPFLCPSAAQVLLIDYSALGEIAVDTGWEVK